MKLNEQKKLYRRNALTIRELSSLPTSRSLEVFAVRGESIEIINRLHQAMNRLVQMGEDKRRSLWFEAKGKKWEWFRLSTSVYADTHYLHITGDVNDHHVLSDKDCANSRYWYAEEELFSALSKIESYIVGLIETILSDPEQYNSYIEKNLSYHRREGLIRRSVLNSLLPNNFFDGIDIAKAIKIYESPQEPSRFSEMTLRSYMYYWRIAYEAVYGLQQGDDIDVFKHSSQGHEAENYNLDSEDDFKRWKTEVSSYHGFDVVYARVHMYPINKNGNWHIHISTGSYWNLDECIKAVLGLTDTGIIPVLGEVSHILGILKETDSVEITPYAYRYMQGEGVGSQMKLPYVDEVDRDTVNKIIENTDWKPIEKVRPID